MNLLVVTQYFAPESFRINDLVSGLITRGHSVTVLTGQPNYPSGNFIQGYGWRGPRREFLLGAEVVRVPLVARRGGGALRLLANYLSFAFFASLAARFRVRGSFDAVLVFGVSPITVGIPAAIAARRLRAPMLFWVLDLWPDSLRAAGAVRSPSILAVVGHFAKWIYSRCALVLVQSRGFEPKIIAQGVSRNRLRYFPNWIEKEYEFRETLYDSSGADLPAGFRIVYAGNIGVAQGFPEIIDAAARLAQLQPEVRWIIAGDGRMAKWVREEVSRRGLNDVMTFLGQQPPEKMPALFESADALLVSLKADPVFALTVPGKVQSYLSAGKPVLAMLDGEGARIVNEAGAGSTCGAGDVDGLVELVRTLVTMTPEKRRTMGTRGQAYAMAEFGRDTLFDRLEGWLREAVEENRCNKK